MLNANLRRVGGRQTDGRGKKGKKEKMRKKRGKGGERRKKREEKGEKGKEKRPKVILSLPSCLARYRTQPSTSKPLIKEAI